MGTAYAIRRSNAMRARVGNGVGRFSVEFEVAHNDDLALARRGLLPADQHLALLGRSYSMYGVLQFRTARYAASEDCFRKAIATLERVHQAAPGNVEATRWLALAHADLGLDLACALSLRGRVSPSEADAAKAIAALHRAIQAGFDNDYQRCCGGRGTRRRG